MWLQKILNPFDKQLAKYKFKNKLNPFDEFEKIKSKDALPAITKGNILLGPIRMSAVGQLFEGIIGYTYRLRGYKVYALMCGQKLNVCESKDLSLKSNAKCAICYSEQQRFCKTFEIEPLYIGDLLTKENEADIKSSLKKLSLNSMLLNDEIDLSKEIKSGLMRILKTSNVDDDKYLSRLNKYGKTSMQTYLATVNAIKKVNPSSVMMSHGVYSTWGAMIKACEDHDIATVVWGRGYVSKGFVMATHGKSFLFENIVEKTSNYDTIELTDEQKQKVLTYFDGKRKPSGKVDYINYYKDKKNNEDAFDIYEKLNIDKSKTLFGMFPNIPWDGQLFSPSKGFPGIRSFAESTIEWFKNHQDSHLVIRAHPAELHNHTKNQLERFRDIVFDLYPTLPDNVTFLDADSNISSYQIEKHVTAALLFGGTIGLEFSINKTPVIQTGKNSSSNKGFLYEPSSEAEFHEMLDKFESKSLTHSNEMYENALKYAHYWIYERHIPEEVIKFEGELQFKGFNIKSSTDLKDIKSVNWFVDKIESKEDFVYRF
jgi:hypothetical protein